MEQLNIYQKLAKIRECAEVLQKNREGHNYKYVDSETILANITGKMKDYHISLVPRILPATMTVMPCPYVNTRFTKDGQQYEEKKNEVIVRADMEYHWVNDDDPDERVIVPWTMIGQSANASQAFGSGLTYCGRYFLKDYFNIATTEDDPDNWRSMQQDALEREQREAANKINEETLRTINGNLEIYPEKRDEVKEVVKKYAKDKNGRSSNNPLYITDPYVASELLKAVKEFFRASENDKE